MFIFKSEMKYQKVKNYKTPTLDGLRVGLKRKKDLGIIYNCEVKVKIGLKRQKDLGIIYNRSYLKVK